MNPSRRQVLGSGVGLAGAAALGCQSPSGTRRPSSSRPQFSISLAEWSLHRALQAGQMTNLDFPVVARRDHAIGAVEYVNSFFKDKARDQAYLKELNLRCADQGVESLLIMVDGEGPLAEPNASARKQAIENHRRWIEAARTLGCHAIRVNAAGSGPAEEQLRCAADSLTELAEVDERISVIVENHGGNSSNGAWLAGVMRRAAHPRVGTLPDFGNFHLGNDVWYDRYQGVQELMPFAKAVSAKSYDFDENGNCKETDYRRMLRIVVAAGYRGFVGIEYEGDHHTEPEGIRLTKRLLERVRGELASS